VSKVADTNLCGASGTKYKFGIYTLETSFENIGAVYIFTKGIVSDMKRNRDFLSTGQTEELANRIYNHEKWPCLETKETGLLKDHIIFDLLEPLPFYAEVFKSIDPSLAAQRTYPFERLQPDARHPQ